LPDRPKTYSRRPAPKAKQGGSTTLRDTSAAYQRQRLAILDAETLCRYCFNQGRLSVAKVLDHIVALSLGGSNDPANLAPACKPCNDAKGKDERAYARKGYDLAMVRFDPALSVWFKLAAIPRTS
jgi:5-methylcytosine-specific restriction protein A